jgi:hypothetical protein
MLRRFAITGILFGLVATPFCPYAVSAATSNRTEIAKQRSTSHSERMQERKNCCIQNQDQTHQPKIYNVAISVNDQPAEVIHERLDVKIETPRTRKRSTSHHKRKPDKKFESRSQSKRE